MGPKDKLPPTSRATVYRELADAALKAANSVRDPEAKDSLRQVAASWTQLAEHVERIYGRIPARKE